MTPFFAFLAQVQANGVVAFWTNMPAILTGLGGLIVVLAPIVITLVKLFSKMDGLSTKTDTTNAKVEEIHKATNSIVTANEKAAEARGEKKGADQAAALQAERQLGIAQGKERAQQGQGYQPMDPQLAIRAAEKLLADAAVAAAKLLADARAAAAAERPVESRAREVAGQVTERAASVLVEGATEAAEKLVEGGTEAGEKLRAATEGKARAEGVVEGMEKERDKPKR